MDWLQTLYPDVRAALQQALPAYWPALRGLTDSLAGEPLIPEALLPLAACRAVGGDERDAVHVSAALVAAAVALRVLDDIQDHDRPDRLWSQIGPARASGYASALQTLAFAILDHAPLDNTVRQRVMRCFCDTFLRIAYGQECDLAGQVRSIEDYWLVVECKIAAAYSAACAAGALVGTEDGRLVQACGDFGYHLGFAVQILNDLESLWRPDGTTDVQRNKLTLPLLYGLSVEHTERAELAELVRLDDCAAHSDRIMSILESIDTRSYLIWSALQARHQALQRLEDCPDPEGKAALAGYVTSLFGAIDKLMPSANQDHL